jgi:hypothetical protein
MAIKGVLKCPVLPLPEAHAKAMEQIEKNDEPVAIFLIAGKLQITKSSSDSFEPNLQRLQSGLVGVYDMGFDHRALREDLNYFYRGALA